MNELHSGSRIEARLWFARFVAIYLALAFALFLALWSERGTFLLLSSVLLVATGLVAWRAAGGTVGRGWGIGLCAALLLTWGAFNLVSQGTGSEDALCLPTYRQAALWARLEAVPPDPACQGRRLDD